MLLYVFSTPSIALDHWLKVLHLVYCYSLLCQSSTCAPLIHTCGSLSNLHSSLFQYSPLTLYLLYLRPAFTAEHNVICKYPNPRRLSLMSSVSLSITKTNKTGLRAPPHWILLTPTAHLTADSQLSNISYITLLLDCVISSGERCFSSGLGMKLP